MTSIYRKIYLLILFLGITMSNSWSQETLGFNILNNAKRVNIPFEIYNNLIVIPVILNNQLPLRFILDTGVRTTILTEKTFSDILNLVYARQYRIAGIGGKNVIDAYITNDVSLTLPGIKGQGHAMLVLAEDYLELRNYLGTDVHGILGYELFSRFIIKINYDRKVLTLMKPEHFKPGRAYKAIPISIEDTKPYVHGTITFPGNRKKDAKLLVDTGASHGLILEETSDPDIVVPENYLISSLGRGLAGELQGKIARLPSFRIDGLHWEGIIATFPQSNTFLDSIKLSTIFRHGSIGGEILSRFKVIFDFPGETLYLKKGVQYKKKFSYNLSGLIVKAKGSNLNTFTIEAVRAGSSGDIAGFEKGDQLVSINHIPVEKLILNQIVGMLNGKENKRLSLEVVRNGKRISKTFRLKSQI